MVNSPRTEGLGSGFTTTVNFDDDLRPGTTDDDSTCTGSAAAPTAPSGKVCIYIYGYSGNIDFVVGYAMDNLSDHGFYIGWNQLSAGDISLFVTWAYTAP